MPAVHSVEPRDLLATLGRPDAPVAVDIQLPQDAAADPWRIPGALRHSFDDAPRLAARLSGRPAVIVCQKGRKLSQGLAALLRCDGLDARYLAGGMMAWRALPGAPAIPLAAIDGREGPVPAWVTGLPLGPELCLSCWILRRFVDRDARLLFVAADEVAAVAERFDARSFAEPAALLDHLHLDLPGPTDLARRVAEDATLRGILDGFARGLPEPLKAVAATEPVFDALCLAATGRPVPA